MATVEYTVAASLDNGRFSFTPPANWLKFLGNLGMGEWSAGRFYRTFLRWPVNIPRGSTVSEATILFRSVGGVNTGDRNLEIRLIDEDNSPDFDYWDEDQGNMPLVAPSVFWPTSVWITDQYYTTTNIASLLQAFIDRPGYSVGNYIGIFISEGTGDLDIRGAYSYDSGPADAAVLTVTYSTCIVPLLAERVM